jgi:hypothetical protein
MVSSSQSLCLACGICCEGAIFRGVPLSPEDEISPLTAAGINIVPDGERNVFMLPCAAHKNHECTVYAHRPRVCQQYRCELLKRFTRGEISQDAALEIIGKTISVRNEVDSLANSTNDPGITLFLRQWIRDPSIGTSHKTYAQLFLKFLILQKFLDRYFRKKPVISWLSGDS